MPNETGHLPDRPRRDAEGALESAADLLRAGPRPAGTTPAREREILSRRQERDLLAWARENDRLIESPFHLSRVEDGGEEHRVWFDVPAQRYFKATHAGRFGFTVIAMHDNTLELTSASPLEYLERLLLQNASFGDDVQLEGVILEKDSTVILTSQSNVNGSAVTAEEISLFMAQLWFQPLPEVKDEKGMVLPIDLILVRAEGPLLKALQAPS
jgi:hypothetical protein